MSIQPASDLILDTLRAADPQRAADATNRLARAADSATTDFAQHLTNAPSPSLSTPVISPTIGRSGGQTPLPEPDARQALGALMLQKLFENMMPSGKGGLFGSGPGSDVWKSMFAEQMAKSVATKVFPADKDKDASANHMSTSSMERAHA